VISQCFNSRVLVIALRSKFRNAGSFQGKRGAKFASNLVDQFGILSSTVKDIYCELHLGHGSNGVNVSSRSSIGSILMLSAGGGTMKVSGVELPLLGRSGTNEGDMVMIIKAQ
jgi:hypothetical protein